MSAETFGSLLMWLAITYVSACVVIGGVRWLLREWAGYRERRRVRRNFRTLAEAHDLLRLGEVAQSPEADDPNVTSGWTPANAMRLVAPGSLGLADLLGQRFQGIDPSQIPDDAQSRKWEAVHLFSPYSKPPKRTEWGVQCDEPPMALQCPDCDLKQPVLQHGGRKCSYCGVRMRVHGSRVYWWRIEEESK